MVVVAYDKLLYAEFADKVIINKLLARELAESLVKRYLFCANFTSIFPSLDFALSAKMSMISKILSITLICNSSDKFLS